MTGGVIVEAFGRSDVGCVREENQDSFAVGDLEGEAPAASGRVAAGAASARGTLLLVCDGMGGPAGGAVAARLAAEVMWGEMRASQTTVDPLVFGRLLRRAVRVANRRVLEEARAARLAGMGTTLSVAGLAGRVVVLAQVGDSRAYVERGGTLTQVTRDQSVVSALMHAGRITPEEARESAQANVILQALGSHEDLEVSLSVVELRRGDRLLLCSDGLHGVLDDAAIERVLAAHDELGAAVDRLIELTLAAGAPDNVTAVLARFSGDGLDEPASAEDLPRFVELDPMEEGERALATTSWVNRRLAARAGLVDDPGPPVVPATGSHRVVRRSAARRRRDRQIVAEGPAAAALAQRSRQGLVAWVVVIVAALAVAALLLSLSG